jgi:hypothetical protein
MELFLLFDWVLRHSDTVLVIWRRSSCTSVGRPQVPYRVLFQARPGTLVEPPTFCSKLDSFLTWKNPKPMSGGFKHSGEGQRVWSHWPKPLGHGRSRIELVVLLKLRYMYICRKLINSEVLNLNGCTITSIIMSYKMCVQTFEGTLHIGNIAKMVVMVYFIVWVNGVQLSLSISLCNRSKWYNRQTEMNNYLYIFKSYYRITV